MKDGKPVRYRYVVAVQLGKSALDR
jgi:hypothetical protein